MYVYVSPWFSYTLKFLKFWISFNFCLVIFQEILSYSLNKFLLISKFSFQQDFKEDI